VTGFHSQYTYNIESQLLTTLILQAGGEAEWYQEMKSEFQHRADSGDEDYKDLLEEVEKREDLKKAYGV
jgi:hypothetical protein